MMRRVIVRPEAEEDLADAWAWYGSQNPDLADRFLRELARTVSLIRARPRAYPRVHKKVRRALTRRFPYAVFFIEEMGAVVILAFSHQARDPERWRERT